MIGSNSNCFFDGISAISISSLQPIPDARLHAMSITNVNVNAKKLSVKKLPVKAEPQNPNVTGTEKNMESLEVVEVSCCYWYCYRYCSWYGG